MGECFFTGDSDRQRAVRILRQTVCSRQVILSSILSLSEQSARSVNTSQHVDRCCSQASVYGKAKSSNIFLPLVCSSQWTISVILEKDVLECNLHTCELSGSDAVKVRFLAFDNVVRLRPKLKKTPVGGDFAHIRRNKLKKFDLALKKGLG